MCREVSLCGIKLRVRGGQGADLLEVHGERAPEAPFRGGQRPDPIDVDGVRVTRPERVVEQQQDRVDDILLVELHDLELGKEQLRERDRGRIGLEPPVQRDHVAELEPIVEDVDMDVRRRVIEDGSTAL